jgi:hypothetical protein
MKQSRTDMVEADLFDFVEGGIVLLFAAHNIDQFCEPL